jgi:hypothetical protein
LPQPWRSNETAGFSSSARLEPRDPEPSSTIDIALLRYKGGSLDHSFSGNGKQRTAFPRDNDQDVAFNQDIAFQSRKKFIVSDVINPAQDFLVVRYRDNGDLDD